MADQKNKYTTELIQFISIKGNKIKTSDNQFFNIKTGSDFRDFHPIFENIALLRDSGEKHIKIESIHINKRICDIQYLHSELNEGIILLTDMTDYYERMRELQQVRNESVIHAETIDLRNRILKEKEEFKDQFLTQFSYQLRNPLTAITTFTSLLNKTDLTPEQKSLAGAVQYNSEMLCKLIDDIIDLSLIRTKQIDGIKEFFDLGRLLSEIDLLYSSRASEKGVKFNLAINPKVPMTIKGDLKAVQQLLSSLIDSAIHTTTTGEINLRVELLQTHANVSNIRFIVEDTGTGYTDEEIALMMHSFKNNVNSGTAHGLSYAIAYGLVEQLDGKIVIHSEVGKGTKTELSLKFKLPLPSDKIEETKKGSESTIKLKRQIETLIIEADPSAQIAVARTLKSSGNFDVKLASGAASALDHLDMQQFDCILMSYDYSDLDGQAFIELIRQSGFDKRYHVEILGMTATHTLDEKKLKKIGLDGLIHKPYNDEELLDFIYKKVKISKFT